ncbi:MAG: hypothetical protein M1818_000711 [Claussenomyces sp. TS43310]|nr:MAG: hypothetical protein M1818_000711 [Claussenomyces sp. TS43310]
MLTAAPHLHTRRPSPTTIEYTVSTHPPATFALRALLTLTFLVRLLLGSSALLLLFCRWQLSQYAMWLPSPADDEDEYKHSSSSPINHSHPFTTNTIWHAIAQLHRSALGQAFTHLAAGIPLPILVPAAAALLYAIVLRIHTEESVLVLRGLGIQTSTSGSTYLARASTRFIPTDKIQDIFVNEAFRRFEVRYYLVVVVQGEEEVVVVFPRLLPCRRIVERVWRGARSCLYEPERDKDGG